MKSNKTTPQQKLANLVRGMSEKEAENLLIHLNQMRHLPFDRLLVLMNITREMHFGFGIAGYKILKKDNKIIDQECVKVGMEHAGRHLYSINKNQEFEQQ